jgi:hypothetical protein
LRRALDGKGSGAPEWVFCLEMAKGDPLRAREIYNELDAEWWFRWKAWKSELAAHEGKQ